MLRQARKKLEVELASDDHRRQHVDRPAFQRVRRQVRGAWITAQPVDELLRRPVEQQLQSGSCRSVATKATTVHARVENGSAAVALVRSSHSITICASVASRKLAPVSRRISSARAERSTVHWNGALERKLKLQL